MRHLYLRNRTDGCAAAVAAATLLALFAAVQTTLHALSDLGGNQPMGLPRIIPCLGRCQPTLSSLILGYVCTDFRSRLQTRHYSDRTSIGLPYGKIEGLNLHQTTVWALEQETIH